MEHLLQYCETQRQREVVETCIEAGTRRKAAESLGIDVRNVNKTLALIRTKASLSGECPERDLNSPVPYGLRIKGTSTLIDKTSGESKLQWVKTTVDEEVRQQMMHAAIESMVEGLPKVPPIKGTKFGNDELIAVYPLGDAHIGMRAWAAECGADWDLAIAEKAFINLFDRLVKTAPNCDQAVIVNLGDWFHADNVSGVTERSGHHLDLDGRYAKMIGVGVKIIRRMIESALEHHKSVRVINAIGNHDDTGAMFLSVALEHMYEDNKRVEIDTSPAPFHYIRHGKVLIGVHHGHTCKAERLPLVMATDKANDWGETEYRYWLTGHIHHDTLKEYSGCKVESFRTIAAKDAYATWGGYRSGQDSKCLVIHKDFGEVERHTINLSMVMPKKGTNVPKNGTTVPKKGTK